MELEDRRRRLVRSLGGLSVGDAFGERFFGLPEKVVPLIEAHALPKGPWRWTDDTQMAVGLARVLLRRGEVVQDLLAREFVAGMDPLRGYGRGAVEILTKVRNGLPWPRAARGAFGGTGSYGNGAAMRVAPLGAFFADAPLETVRDQAVLSAEVTHAHPEGIAGAVAVAVAAALACGARDWTGPLGPDWLAAVRDAVPAGATRRGIDAALGLRADATVTEAAGLLGSGREVSAPDTVPFCLWVCAHRAPDLAAALWTTVRGLGDRDTTCAIVGGIMGSRFDAPLEWLARREPLPDLDADG